MKGTSWGWIIAALIIFWPVGLFLLIRKLATDKSALMSGKTGILSAIGCFLLVIAFFGVVGEFTVGFDASSIVIWSVFVIGGILLLRKASKTKKTAARYKKYINIVVNQNVRSIDNIASAVGLTYDVAAKDLQDMINIGYLKDAYINQGNREICLKQHQQQAVPAQEIPAGQAALETQIIRCPGCGANNAVVPGKVSECEYCSTPIKA